MGWGSDASFHKTQSLSDGPIAADGTRRPGDHTATGLPAESAPEAIKLNELKLGYRVIAAGRPLLFWLVNTVATEPPLATLSVSRDVLSRQGRAKLQPPRKPKHDCASFFAAIESEHRRHPTSFVYATVRPPSDTSLLCRCPSQSPPCIDGITLVTTP